VNVERLQRAAGARLAWDQLWAIIWKDLRSELRTRQAWMSMGLFALRGPMDRLLTLPVDRAIIYLAKVIGNVIVISVVELVALPVFAALYNLPVLTWPIVPITLLGTLGVAAVGTQYAALAANTRARELLTPLLIFPLITPVVIGAVRATEALFSPLYGDAPWLSLLVAFDVIMLSVSAVTFQYAVED
jgi:heme exporter protein B